MTYDILLFSEILESIPGIQFLRDGSHNGYKAKMFQGLAGNLVIIDMTNEEIDEELGSIYLNKLGLGSYIERLFPRNEPK